MSAWKGRSVLVTGGAGFIGSELVRQLVGYGAEVIVVDNLVNGRRENLSLLSDHQVRLVVDDIRNAQLMETLLDGRDVVFHLACLGVRHSIHAPYENHEVNAAATLNLLNLAREKNVGRFVYVSTSEVYGTAVQVPMTEEHPLFPHTVYGASKLAGECYTRAYYKTYKFETVVVRPFNAYGPHCHHEGDSGEVIPKFLLRCLAGLPMVIFGDGTQTRDFTYVADTAAGIIAAGLSDKSVGQTINLGSGMEISINELASKIASTVGSNDFKCIYEKPRPGDVFRLLADNAKAKMLLGYQPQIPLHEGLEKLKQWYLNLAQDPGKLLESEVVMNWQRPNYVSPSSYLKSTAIPGSI